MIIVVGVALLIGIVWGLSDPFAALITLMGVDLVNPGDIYPLFNALHLERLVAVLAVVVLFMRGYRFVYPRVTRHCLYFYAACVASIPLGFWISNALTNVIDFGKVIATHLLYVTLVTTRRRMQIVLVSFSLLVGYLCVSSLILYFHGQFQNTMNVDRITGLAGSSTTPDSLGLTLVTAMPIIYLFTRKGGGAALRLLMWGILGLSLWTLLLTGARGVLFTLVLLLLIGIALHRRRLLVLPLVVVLAGAIWAGLPTQYKVRYTTINDQSYLDRFLSWQGGWQMFLSNPATGMGIGNYAFANGSRYWPAPRKIYLNAHSLYFQLIGELGLVGVVTFGSFVWVLIASNNDVRKRLREIAAQARAGDARAQAVPEWLRLFPTACTLSVIGLLYCGYGYHDLYRSTWYFLAAATGAADLLTARELEQLKEQDPQPAGATGAQDMAPGLCAAVGMGGAA